MKPPSLGVKNLEVDRLRICMLYQQSAVSQVVALANSLLYALLSWSVVERSRIVVWTVVSLAIVTIRFVVHQWFAKTYVQGQRPFSPRTWEMVFLSGTLVAGLNWGVAAITLLPAADLGHQAFLGFMLAGTTAGAVVAYCTSIKVVESFLLSSVLPFALRLTWEGGEFRLAMAALSVVYVVAISLLIVRINKYVVDSITLRFEKDQLLTELLEAQSKITDTAKMAALGVMAGGIAHEINNPLTTIRLVTFSLRDHVSSQKLTPQKMISLSDSIDASVSKISRVISGLRTFAVDGNQEARESVSIQTIVSETLDFCRTRFKENDIQLIVMPINPDYKVLCQKAQIAQVLLNLLSNAFDAVCESSDRWVRIEVREDLEFISLAVMDSGRGIERELRDKIMQPFFTTKDVGKGTGLGLSIAHGIIKGHGGTLTLDANSPNTCFVVGLPRIAQERVNAA